MHAAHKAAQLSQRGFLTMMTILLILFSAVIANAARQTINVGTSVNARDGDPLRTAFIKANSNFAEIYDEGLVKHVPSVAALQTVNPTSYSLAVVHGYHSAGDGGGGLFFPTNTITGTNVGTLISTTNITGWSWKRIFSPPVSVKWYGAKGDGVQDDYTAIAAAIQERHVFFPKGTYLAGSGFTLDSDTSLIGSGSIVRNISPNSGAMLFTADKKQNIRVDGLVLDCGSGSHYNSGVIEIKGCTNVTLANSTFKNGGYLANIYVHSSSGASSQNVVIENCEVLDQRYGSASTSTASLTIAESALSCRISNTLVDYVTVSPGSLPWVALPGNPAAPSIAIGLDRAYNCTLEAVTVKNTAGMTNISAIVVEDNSGATNIHNSIHHSFVEGHNFGLKFNMLTGRTLVSGTTFQNCTQQAIDLSASESAETNDVKSVVVRDCKFINNNASAPSLINAGSFWENKSGQIRFSAQSPNRMLVDGCDFVAYESANTNFCHILFGSGNLTVRNSTFENGFHGIRPADPLAYSDTTPNSLYNAFAPHRKMFMAEGNTFSGTAIPVSTVLYNPYSDSNLTSDDSRHVITAYVYTNVPVSSVTKIFSVLTVPTSQTAIGTSGSYLCIVDGMLSTGNNTIQSYGDIGSSGFRWAWSHSVNDGAESPANSSVSTVATTGQAKTGSRGIANTAFTVNSPSYSQTDARIFGDAEGGISEFFVYARVTLIHTGFYHPPRIIR